MKGKIILNLAVSLDGYIAQEDGGYEWIVGDGDNTLDTAEKLDHPKFMAGIDVVVMGRDCYEQGMAEAYSDKTVYVATSENKENTENITFIKGDIVSILQKEQDQGKNIYLFGGGKVIDPFIKADSIDEYIIGIIPTILGNGRKLFLGDNPMINLHLDKYAMEGGVAMLYYSKRK